jgi:hypothetical protein
MKIIVKERKIQEKNRSRKRTGNNSKGQTPPNTPAPPANAGTPPAVPPAASPAPANINPPESANPGTPPAANPAPGKPAEPGPKKAPAPLTPEKKESIKKKYASLWNFGFYKRINTDNPKLARALLGTLTKAEQYAGTPQYIPILVSALVGAGIPEDKAKETAKVLSKKDSEPTDTTPPIVPTEPRTANPADVTPTAPKTDNPATAAPNSANNGSSELASTIPLPDLSGLPALDSLTREKIQSNNELLPGDVLGDVVYNNKPAKLLNFSSEATGGQATNKKYVIAPTPEANENNTQILDVSADELSNFRPTPAENINESIIFRKSDRGIFVLKG